MNHMKDSILVGSLALALILAIATGFTKHSSGQSPSTQLNMKDLAEHGLVMVGPSDPSYAGLISILVKGKSDPVVESLAPFSVFMKNNGRRTVVGCILKWEMLQRNGRIRTLKTEYTNLLGLMGSDITEMKDGLVIRPDSSWFFTPSYLQVSQDESTTNGSASISPETMKDLRQAGTQLAEYISITVTLDGAFFDDGTFVGSDTQFFAKVEAMRNARRDLFRELERDIQQAKTNDDLIRHIERIAHSPKVELNSSSLPTEYYGSFRHDAAAELLRIRNSEGVEKVVERVQREVRKSWPELRKI